MDFFTDQEIDRHIEILIERDDVARQRSVVALRKQLHPQVKRLVIDRLIDELVCGDHHIEGQASASLLEIGPPNLDVLIDALYYKTAPEIRIAAAKVICAIYQNVNNSEPDGSFWRLINIHNLTDDIDVRPAIADAAYMALNRSKGRLGSAASVEFRESTEKMRPIPTFLLARNAALNFLGRPSHRRLP